MIRAAGAIFGGLVALSLSGMRPIETILHAGTTNVHAFVYAKPTAPAPVILLFHQAGSNHGEYASIAVQLATRGYGVIALDQRSGGDLYSPGNATVAEAGGNDPNFLDVTADLDAALAYTRRTFPASPVYVWGSSYSASLVFELAATHPHDVAAVLAFSPGEYFADTGYVHRYAREIHVPVFVDSAADSEEEAAARSIVDAVPSKHKVLYTPHHGIHGSSTLNPDRDPDGVGENWSAVRSFLTSLKKP